MNLRVELVHLNSSGFQIYKFNINLYYKSNSEVEPHPGSTFIPSPKPHLDFARCSSKGILLQAHQTFLSITHPQKLIIFVTINTYYSYI